MPLILTQVTDHVEALARIVMVHLPNSHDAPDRGDTYVQASDPRGWLIVFCGRWFGGPPRVWQIVLMGLACGFVIYATSFPCGLADLRPVATIAGFLAWTCLFWPGGIILLGIDYVIRTTVCAASQRFNARDWRWYLAGAFLVGTLVAWKTEPLQRWRFSANRPALERTVATLLQTTSATGGQEGDDDVNWPFSRFDWYRGGLIGDYSVREVAVFPEARVVYLSTGGFFRAGWGFLYDPDGRVNTSYIRLSPLGNGWSVFAYSKE